MRDTGDGNYSMNQFDYYCPVCDAGYHVGAELLIHLKAEHDVMEIRG